MKRRRAIQLFGSLTIMVVGYVLWCSQRFLIKPDLAFDPDVPTALHDPMREWYEEQDITGPFMFTMERLLENLMHPHDAHVRPVKVIKSRNGATIQAQDYSGYFITFLEMGDGTLSGPLFGDPMGGSMPTLVPPTGAPHRP